MSGKSFLIKDIIDNNGDCDNGGISRNCCGESSISVVHSVNQLHLTNCDYTVVEDDDSGKTKKSRRRRTAFTHSQLGQKLYIVYLKFSEKHQYCV